MRAQKGATTSTCWHTSKVQVARYLFFDTSSSTFLDSIMEKKLKVFYRAKVFKHHKSLVLSRSLSHTFREIPRARICVCVSFGRIKKCGGVSCLLVKSESVRVAMHSKRGAGYKAKMKFETLRKNWEWKVNHQENTVPPTQNRKRLAIKLDVAHTYMKRNSLSRFATDWYRKIGWIWQGLIFPKFANRFFVYIKPPTTCITSFQHRNLFRTTTKKLSGLFLAPP